MPALLVDTSTRPASSSDASTRSHHSAHRSRSPTPDRPPVSPLTPTATAAQLAPVERSEARPRPAPPPTATFTPQPPSVAISESDNPDAIALRSAISLLQLQRDKSKRDLKALEDLKAAAIADPQAFARSLHQQRAQQSHSYQDILTPTLSGLGHDQDATHPDARNDSARIDAEPSAPRFPPIPQPQNVVRCPPINWDKYHIVGEPLDKIHQEQKKWPGSADPPRTKAGHRAPPHSVAAPYSPFTDGISARASSSSSATPPQPPKHPKKSPS
ncbi:hypothetical protein COCC4DRAFT_48884 [Bipolaris maydis ATCC 48331]|uniref:Uncharacterized protein n=2 Tax=Cochliobolus heterostrophus TaxID=5016 RepID=M2V1S0_COCH5|nr:uncharacterized protein COCC4DRAFT_48884 [Bipolaris maydis ATCC 48331]EMD93872.1 hypothetical protein COCHEDRAFT_1201723 [Bipolaris maydis C5]KAH7564285.1 hypothetical protein BM1_01332 [Bipolaris maydis]ENI07824.1 hypothetical protein COCC4DRAFT_48884 [Bipolaris maydis ATCC 48331]KAJ5026910.1 hypothetical protein J3E73DRAFT_232668 [Bipolaris maydis]KAJ5059346.1 hypothetical protein J3E74DRAFT_245646 [Bipolaris maydis]